MLYQLKLTIMYLDNVRGGPQHTKNIETRNKQLEAQIADVNFCRDEDANMLQEADQAVENYIQALERANMYLDQFGVLRFKS